jgi:hypothetical protein
MQNFTVIRTSCTKELEEYYNSKSDEPTNNPEFIENQKNRNPVFSKGKKMLLKKMEALVKKTGCEISMFITTREGVTTTYSTPKSIPFTSDDTILSEYTKSLEGEKDNVCFSNFCARCCQDKEAIKDIISRELKKPEISESHIRNSKNVKQLEDERKQQEKNKNKKKKKRKRIYSNE